MKASDLSYVIVPTEETYIESSKYNAIAKRDIELKLLYQNSQSLPVFFEDQKAYVISNPNNYNLESDEIIMDWVRKLRIDGLSRETPMLKTSFHDGFVSLFSLNSLRKLGCPNFLYYYGIMTTESNVYALSEYTFNSDYKKWKTLEDICSMQSYEVILKYYLSILLTIYQANYTCNYTHYNLTPADILMKPVDEKEYETEYQFRGGNLYINNGHYIPLITNHHKAYVSISLDGNNKSFGYNNIDDIPFEFKGIYCDRGFPITDAYSLLKHILKILKDASSPAYKRFKLLETFFSEISREQEYFIPYYKKEEGPTLGDFIDFIIKNNEKVISAKISKPLLRCIGFNLEIKSNVINYYSAKNLIQLYDLIKFNLIDYDKAIMDSSLSQFNRLYMKEVYKKEITHLESIKEMLNSHVIIYEVPDNTKLFQNKKYRDVLIKNMKSMIVYINGWEKAKTLIEILNFLADFDKEYETLYEHYRTIMNFNQGYYDTLIKQLRNIRQVIHNDKEIYNLFLNEVLILETLE